MQLIDRLHAFADRLGLKPSVFDGVIAAAILVVANWLGWGEPLDFSPVRIAAAGVVIGLVQVLAPAARGVDQRDVLEAAPDLRARARRRR